MSPLTLTVAAFGLALVVMSGAFMGGAVIVAVPVAIVAVGIAALVDMRRKRKSAQSIQSHREQTERGDVDFTDRDRQTLVSE
jgi:hypothetical protein